MNFPTEPGFRTQANNPEAIASEFQLKTRLAGEFPTGRADLMLVAAWVWHIPGTGWGHTATTRHGQSQKETHPGGRIPINPKFTRFHPIRVITQKPTPESKNPRWAT